MATKKSWLDGGVHGSVDGTTSHVEGRNKWKSSSIPPVATIPAAFFCQRPFVLLKSCISSGLTCDQWRSGATFRCSGKYQVTRGRLCTSQGPPFRFWQVLRAECFELAVSSIVSITEDHKHIWYINNTHARLKLCFGLLPQTAPPVFAAAKLLVVTPATLAQQHFTST